MRRSGKPSADRIALALEGRFRSLSLLATQGGQGITCKATSADGTVVALKVYNRTHVEERSEREVSALRQLNSDRIVRLFDAGAIEINEERYQFIATTFVEGTALSEVIARGPVTASAAAVIVADVAEAIDALWSLRVVHRDIKPENIIVDPNGRAVLIDLGIARHLDKRTLTTAGLTYGTLGYLAPEHIAGRAITFKADVFALGIVFQEMLLGWHPTEGRQDRLGKGGLGTHSIKPDLPSKIAFLIDKMVAEKAFDRPGAIAILAELRGSR